MRRSAPVLALALLCAAVGREAVRPAPVRPAPSFSSNLLLITVDTLRPDALGWVAGRNETPAIDRLAREGFRFPAAVSPVPLTLPAHASLMTGRIPRRHGVRDNGQVLGGAPPTLAAALARRGWSTGAFVSGYPLQALFGLDRGFRTYDDRMPEGAEGWVERRAAETTEAALAWIRSAKPPWFAWVHYYDPHDPYEPPRTFWKPGARGAYDGEVAYVDYWVGKLRDGVPPAAARSLLTVLTADHGEALGEHRERTHGFFLYDATMRVPLVFHQPGRVAPGESRAPVRLVDVAPTVAELLGAPRFADVDGVSLVPTLGGKPQAIPPAYLETRLPWIYFGWAPLQGLLDGNWKLIAAPRPELYDLARDPAEAANQVDARRPEARRLIAAMREVERRPASAAGAADDPEAVARLRALGYLGAGGGDKEPPAGLPDPKDRVELRDRLQDAEQAFRRGDLAAAQAGFAAVLAVEPDNRFAVLRSGVASLRQGRLEEAAARLARAVALDPERAEARFALADALLGLGRAGAAVPHLFELVRLQPRRADGWSNLGLALQGAGQPERAVAAHREAVKLDAENARRRGDLAQSLLRLAQSQAGSGHRDAARRTLGEALRTDPALRPRAEADPKLAPLLR